jgi:hypothetical protein
MIVARETRGAHNPEGMTWFGGREAYHPFGVENKSSFNLESVHPFGVVKNNA